LYFAGDWSVYMSWWVSITWPVLPSLVAGAVLRQWRWLLLPSVPFVGSFVYAAVDSSGTGGYVEGWGYFEAFIAFVEFLGLAIGMALVRLVAARRHGSAHRHPSDPSAV
jgi:hypothetical protein